MTGDGSYVYGWNEFGKMKWEASSGTPTCGTTGSCITYDAFGRMVEWSVSSTYYETWITPIPGGTVNAKAGSIQYARWPTPEIGAFVISGSVGTGQNEYLYTDWLGNARVAATPAHTVEADQAYAPYGEQYAQFGGEVGNSYFADFASLQGNFAYQIMWDTPNRELSFVGRWLSPDPAGAGWN